MSMNQWGNGKKKKKPDRKMGKGISRYFINKQNSMVSEHMK